MSAVQLSSVEFQKLHNVLEVFGKRSAVAQVRQATAVFAATPHIQEVVYTQGTLRRFGTYSAAFALLWHVLWPSLLQGLRAPITDIWRLRSSDQRLYLQTAASAAGSCTLLGGLKVGGKKLFIHRVSTFGHAAHAARQQWCCAATRKPDSLTGQRQLWQ